MKLVTAERSEDLQTRIKSRFADFNRTSSPSQGRLYPEELKLLIQEALDIGLEPVVLHRMTGVSFSAIRQWSKTARPIPVKRSPKAVVTPRRLEVVGEGADRYRAPVVVRLPSGVSIEFGDVATLNREILMILASPEVNHAASR